MRALDLAMAGAKEAGRERERRLPAIIDGFSTESRLTGSPRECHFRISTYFIPRPDWPSGFLVGLTGVGGGSLMTPLLVLLFGIHPATAVGTDLLYAAATKTAGTLVHGIKGSVDWRITGRLAAGSVPAAAITLLLLQRYGVHAPGTARLIQMILGSALLITAVSLVFRPQLARLAYKKGQGRPDHPRRTVAWTVLTGAILGVLVSITSVGAGAIGVTVLLLLYPRLADRAHRRLRHRPRRSAHADRGHRPLAARLGRLGAARVAAGRLAAGDRDRQPAFVEGPGSAPAQRACRDARPRRREARVQLIR